MATYITALLATQNISVGVQELSDCYTAMLSAADDARSLEGTVPGWHTLMHRLKTSVQAAAAIEAADNSASDDVSSRNGVSEADCSNGASILSATNSILEQLLLWGQTAKAEQNGWQDARTTGTCNGTSHLLCFDMKRCTEAFSMLMWTCICCCHHRLPTRYLSLVL